MWAVLSALGRSVTVHAPDAAAGRRAGTVSGGIVITALMANADPAAAAAVAASVAVAAGPRCGSGA